MNRVRRSDGLSVTSSLPNSKLCTGEDLPVLLDMPAVVARDHGIGPRGYERFSLRSTSCSAAKSMSWPKHAFQL